jgi:hypothetical protein
MKSVEQQLLFIYMSMSKLDVRMSLHRTQTRCFAVFIKSA